MGSYAANAVLKSPRPNASKLSRTISTFRWDTLLFCTDVQPPVRDPRELERLHRPRLGGLRPPPQRNGAARRAGDPHHDGRVARRSEHPQPRAAARNVRVVLPDAVVP